MEISKDWQVLPTNDTSYYNFPVSILQDFIRDTQEGLDKMLKWAVYDWVKKYSVEHGKVRYKENTMREILESLGIHTSVNFYTFYKACGQVYSKYKGARTGIARKHYWELVERGFIGEADKVLLLSFLAAKSIIGRKEYCKTNDLLLFARMNGFDAAFHDVEELNEKGHLLIRRYYTRRRRDTIKMQLAETFHIVTYSNHDRGYFISSKLSLEELIEVVETSRKNSTGTYKKKVSHTRDLVLARLAQKPP